MTPTVSIVGKKKCGKTTTIEKVVPVLKKRGYRVGTIKHDAHSFEIDHPGKDSYKHFKAGADTTIITSKDKTAIIKRNTVPTKLEEIIETSFNSMMALYLLPCRIRLVFLSILPTLPIKIRGIT